MCDRPTCSLGIGWGPATLLGLCGGFQWRLIGVQWYTRLLVMIVLVYSYFEVVACTSDVRLPILYMSSQPDGDGHVVAVVLVVDQLLTPAGVQDQDVFIL